MLITPSLIPATGNGQGARYEWRDTDIEQEAVYTYWLVETELQGQTFTYGPVRSQPVIPAAGVYTIFLPEVSR